MLYLTNDDQLLPFFLPLGIIGFFRYLWFFIKVTAWFFYRPVLPKANPTYSPDDVTIIVPTIDAGEEFKIAARSWMANDPHEILIITEKRMRGPLQQLADEVNPDKIRVLTVSRANKRLQMTEGINNCNTEIIVFADDDAIWKPTFLEYVLACFEDLKMGGVGTCQTVHAVDPSGYQTVWEVLAGFRLSFRNIEVAASTHIDGGVCCISGRTAAYRTLILKDPAFQYGFTNDLWRDKYPLNSGDDKFLTRWMVSHGWNTYIQVCPEAELYSTFKNNWRFIKQVLRWTRNTWRSDFRSLFMERYIWFRHPYVAFTMLDKFFNPFTLLAGPFLVGVYAFHQVNHPHPKPLWNILVSYICWLLLTRAFKLTPHLLRRPQDIIHIPAWLIFGYYFAIMKLYALFTLHEVAWGTRAGVGTTLAADIAKEDAAAATKMQRDHNDVKIELNDLGSHVRHHEDKMCEDDETDDRYSGYHHYTMASRELGADGMPVPTSPSLSPLMSAIGGGGNGSAIGGGNGSAAMYINRLSPLDSLGLGIKIV
ncbi:nucleotide-diphospho-sugar transferase [Jimgerdemannia flammicorona]|uniref:Nucleotide-diphospho-sugar transferase n=1 Tax=Jimgerdemannia flammicorona TaxID=994334 RepID=A0A433QYD3_9FUNG|nr:nucleotide-diphospho-sugar transferase [Jimgerdemannia flammicorona]